MNCCNGENPAVAESPIVSQPRSVNKSDSHVQRKGPLLVEHMVKNPEKAFKTISDRQARMFDILCIILFPVISEQVQWLTVVSVLLNSADKTNNRSALLIISAVNEARAMRVAEIMNDFRNLQHYIAQIKANPSPEEYYEEGYAILRQCAADAQAILTARYDSGPLQVPTNNGEHERLQLQRIMLDASARRFQAQRIFLRTTAAIRWVNSRYAILQGQKPHAGHVPALQAANNNLRAELSTITDERVVNDLRTVDYQAGHWLQEDPPLYTLLSWIRSAQ